MKISTLNINSINARIENLCDWLKINQPDVLLLQEIKTEFNNFPFFDIQTIGYDAKILGQKSYNGVAILSKHKISVKNENLPNFIDENSRYIEAEITINNNNILFSSIYLPNGNPPYNNINDTTKFNYKLQWMDAFLEHAENIISKNKNIILAGDFNVIMSDKDVYNPELFKGNALFRKEVIQRLQKLSFIGYCDVFRNLYPKENGYTFWDYTGNALQNDFGMRIDYIFTSPFLTDKLKSCTIDKNFRQLPKSSDHTVLTANFED